jgi:hypothetical protein
MGVRTDTIEGRFDAAVTMWAPRTEEPPGPVPPGVRVGVYRSEMPEMDEGWTRWVLDRFHVHHAPVRNRDVLAGGLAQRFDAIIIPDQPPASISQGYAPGSMPPEFAGGLGRHGADELLAFTRAGGTLVFLNRSSDYAVDTFSLPLKNAVRGLASSDFYSPGEILNARVTDDALTVGMPRDIAVWAEHGPAWDVPPGTAAHVLVRYPARDVLASGWLLGERYIAGRAAMVELREGAGRIILFGFRPQYRGQSYQTFRLLFNCLGPAQSSRDTRRLRARRQPCCSLPPRGSQRVARRAVAGAAASQ